jgi:geranylgeranyl diphosphate synthase type II
MDVISKNYSFNELKKIIDEIINKFIEKESNLKIKEIFKHSLNGGKRIRPIILFLVFKSLIKNQDFDFDFEKFKNLLIVPELIHNVSLIIDDLPCMDNDNYRRNKESTHFKFGIIPSYISITKIIHNILYEFKNDIDTNKHFFYKDKEKCVKPMKIVDFIDNSILETINDLIDGQYYDLNLIKLDLDLDVIYKINSKKTSPLFVLSFLLGYMGILLFDDKFVIEENMIDKLTSLGEIFGFIFQLNDDIIDSEEDAKEGKNLNISLHLGKDKSLEIFNIKCNEFEKKLDELNLWNDNFKDIIQLLKKRINI